ncbi:hypothetical protein [Frankia tisae]|uniref:hypothetical protein n=1 Tax=Frankia tisae TaxID=2950104 RepID=UPI0021C0DE6D|nr:hypothetical protein [Frankia tisae]
MKPAQSRATSPTTPDAVFTAVRIIHVPVIVVTSRPAGTQRGQPAGRGYRRPASTGRICYAGSQRQPALFAQTIASPLPATPWEP